MILRDLEKLMQACRNRFDALPPAMSLEIPNAFWHDFKVAYELENNDKVVAFDAQWFSIAGRGDKPSDMTSRWLLYAYAFAPYYRELVRYRNVLNNVLMSSGPIEGLKKEILSTMPASDWAVRTDALAPTATPTLSSCISGRIHSVLPDAASASRFNRFLEDGAWWGQGKDFGRGEKDWLGSAVRTAAGVIHANYDRLPQVIQAVAENPPLLHALKRLVRHAAGPRPGVPRKSGGQNVIYYGAPGTGKSHKIDTITGGHAAKNVTRTVFHADTQYGDFAGSFRPSIANGDLVYAYQPGPFTAALVKAMNSPGEMHYLVIEEINRASAAAAFGEIFQLLDRDAAGTSVYAISPSDPSQETYLAATIVGWKGKIMLPSNLSILASMNSSDQAVMPLDTAFKRRWRFEYLPVNFDSCPAGVLPVPDGTGTHVTVKWSDFAQAINDILTELKVPEDRLLGPYFLSVDELDDAAAPISVDSAGSRALYGKLFLYLWDDVLRHGARESVFSTAIRTYGQLVGAYADGRQVLSDQLQRKLFPVLPATTAGELEDA